MIVQCDACSTKFRLDDSKGAAKGVKVRCTKCQNVFVVMPPSPPQEETAPKTEESFDASFGTQPEPSPPAAEKEAGGFSFEAPSTKEGEKKDAAAPSEEPLFSFEEKRLDSLGFSFDAGLPPAGEKTSFEIELPPTEEEFVVSIKEEAKTVVMQPRPVTPPLAQAPAE